ncbi:hypothetical protein BaRGS_00028063 [Batillaria attramentaria]|uniref:Uncharacterized protein n=1 Tax=Batillaria attramentaria TaxID=370345 RepID=A0ABD0K008_9CAEN
MLPYTGAMISSCLVYTYSPHTVNGYNNKVIWPADKENAQLDKVIWPADKENAQLDKVIWPADKENAFSASSSEWYVLLFTLSHSDVCSTRQTAEEGDKKKKKV